MSPSLRNAFLTGVALLVPIGCIFSSGGKGKKLPAQVPRGYYAFTVPQPYASLNMDSTYTLAWTTTDSAGSGPVRLALYRKDAFLANLSASTANNGTYPWSLPSTRSASGYRMGSGGEYRLRITNAADSSKWDFSDWFSMFSHWSGYVTLTAPASGARTKLDSSLNITWTSSGEVGPLLGLQLYKDTVLAGTISTLVSNNGSYSWLKVVSALGSGDDYHIRLFSIGDPSISSVGPAFRIVSGFTGGYAFRFPASGDTLTTGGFTKATWTVTGGPGASSEITLWRDSVKLATVAYPSTAATDSVSWTVPAGLTTSARYRLRIASASDAGIFAWSGYFTIKGAEADAYENDDSLSLSKTIAPDGKVQAHTLTLKDMDWMRFAAKAEKRYLVSLRSSVTMYVNVLDTAGRLLKEQSGANVQITLTPGYSGIHHVKVFPYSTSASALGPYQIAVSEYDSTGSPFNAGFITPDGKTTWAAGSRYSITWAPDSLIFGGSVVLSLYDDTVLVSALAGAVPNLGVYAWDIPAGTYTGQKYRLRMSPYANPQVIAYGPRFAISGVTPDAYEPDNARLTAKSIAADGKPQLRGLSIGDQDWIRFDAAKGRRYVAAFATKLSMYAYLMDSSGNQLSYQSGYKIALALAPAYNGTHYLRVIENIGNGEYSVTLTPYDSTADGYPTRFTLPDSAATWAAGTAYTVSWVPDSALFGANVSLALWQDDQFLQAIASSVPNNGSFAWTLHASLATGPRYRLRMTGTSTSTTPAAAGFGPRFSISGIVPDVYEPDPSKAAAKPIVADGGAQQRNLTVGDTDWVRLDAVAAKTYIVSVNGQAASVLLAATDSAGVSLATQSGTKFAATFTPPKDGRVYLRVTSASGFGPYALTAVAYTAGQDGVPVRFTAPDSATAWSAGSSYTASWNPDSAIFGSAVGLALIKGGTLLTTLVSSQSNTGTAQVFLPAGLATGSDYRIRLLSGNNALLYGHSALFSIGGIPADSFEPNDSSAAAKAWVPNAPRQTLSLSYRDKDWFRFAATAQMLYLIQAVSPASLHTTLRILPESGTGALLTGTKTGTDTLTSLAWVAPAAGNYAVSLEAVSTVAYGSYAFEIKEVDPGSYKFPVAAPAAGAAFKAGDAINVQWSDPAGVKGQVDLFLYNADGVVQTVAANQANTGAYAWTAPAGLPARSDYYVKIISRLNSGINGASGAFSLAP